MEKRIKDAGKYQQRIELQKKGGPKSSFFLALMFPV